MSEINFRPATQIQSSSESHVNNEIFNRADGPNSEVKLGDIMPISSYEAENGFPFTSEYYKMDTKYEFIDSAMRDDLETIDGFVKQYIKDENKNDDIASYVKTLKSLEKKLGIDDSTMRTAAIKKVANLVKNYNKAADAFGRNIKRKILAKLIRMNNEGHSQFDQEEYLLQELGGII